MKHWRDTYNSEYLASWDLDTNEILTFASCKEEECKLAKGKEKKVVGRFIETVLSNGVKVKPIILNPTNCKFIQIKTGLQFPETWTALKVTVSVQENKGGIGEKQGLRIINVIKPTTKVFDIEEILNLDDLEKAKKLANESKYLMTENEKTQVRNHITFLSENV